MNKANNISLIFTILSQLPKSRDSKHAKIHLLVLSKDPDDIAPYYECYVINKSQGELFCIVRNLIHPDIVEYEYVSPESFENRDIYFSVYDSENYPEAHDLYRSLQNLI